MTDEIRVLREALQRLLDMARETAEEDTPGMRQADFALTVTSGKLPPGYSIDEQDVASGRIHPRLNGQFLLGPKGRPKYAYDLFKARLFCWQHYLGEEVAS